MILGKQILKQLKNNDGSNKELISALNLPKINKKIHIKKVETEKNKNFSIKIQQILNQISQLLEQWQDQKNSLVKIILSFLLEKTLGKEELKHIPNFIINLQSIFRKSFQSQKIPSLAFLNDKNQKSQKKLSKSKRKIKFSASQTSIKDEQNVKFQTSVLKQQYSKKNICFNAFFSKNHRNINGHLKLTSTKKKLILKQSQKENLCKRKENPIFQTNKLILKNKQNNQQIKKVNNQQKKERKFTNDFYLSNFQKHHKAQQDKFRNKNQQKNINTKKYIVELLRNCIIEDQEEKEFKQTLHQIKQKIEQILNNTSEIKFLEDLIQHLETQIYKIKVKVKSIKSINENKLMNEEQQIEQDQKKIQHNPRQILIQLYQSDEILQNKIIEINHTILEVQSIVEEIQAFQELNNKTNEKKEKQRINVKGEQNNQIQIQKKNKNKNLIQKPINEKQKSCDKQILSKQITRINYGAGKLNKETNKLNNEILMPEKKIINKKSIYHFLSNPQQILVKLKKSKIDFLKLEKQIVNKKNKYKNLISYLQN